LRTTDLKNAIGRRTDRSAAPPGDRPVMPHRAFDPRRVGSLESAAWVAYYRRDWLPFMRSAIGLTRHTFGLPWPSTLYGAWLVMRANQLWAPSPDNDPDGARHAMERFYRSDRWVAEGCDLASPLIGEERTALVRSYAALLAVVHRV
jgi:hypothetical protein